MITNYEKLAEMELYSKNAESYGHGDLNTDVVFLKRLINDFTLKYQPDIVLDLGTGNGRYLKSVNTNKIIGIDISLNMLKKVESKDPNLLLCDAFFLPFKDNSFDMVYAIGMLGLHVPLNHEILDEIYRVLTPAGYFLFTTTTLKSRYITLIIKKIFGKILPDIFFLKNYRLRMITSKYANSKRSIYNNLSHRFEIVSLEEVTPTFPQYLTIAKKNG